MFLLLICYYCGYQGTEETIERMKTGVEKKTEHIRLLVKVSRSSPEFKSIGSVLLHAIPYFSKYLSLGLSMANLAPLHSLVMPLLSRHVGLNL